MKTTIEISDALLQAARRLAEREGITLRGLVERGLHRVLADAQPQAPFKLRRASFRGEGLQPDFRGASWDRLLGAVYLDRGA
ncbi:MAG: type II toxin-antitoxin system VapB family antitoxin [Bradyrhizobium sp.]